MGTMKLVRERDPAGGLLLVAGVASSPPLLRPRSRSPT